jgi:GNAT superfamily N-acetyltransferase
MVELVREDGTIIHVITTPDSPYLGRLVTAFRAVFPEYDSYITYLRLSADRDHPPRPTTIDHLWLVERGGVDVGFRLFSYLPKRRFGFGAYTGILPQFRGLGLGRWLMTQTLNQVIEDAQTLQHDDVLGCCVEIMRVESEQNAEEQARNAQSLAFHQRCGAVLLNLPYRELQVSWDDIQNGVTDERGIPKHLAMYFAPGRDSLSASELMQVVEGIYLDVYLQTVDHPVLLEVIQAINVGR